MKLSRTCLKVRNAAGLSNFYTAVLGMRKLGSEDSPAFGYVEEQCLLEFHEVELQPYQPASDDLYWKIGITLQNLDSAVKYLNAQGWPVSAPRQFRDIGYLCHLQDPEGFQVELLQQGFEGNHGFPAASGHPIGGQATLAHLTLRVADIEAIKGLCEGELGMRLMSVQPVPERGFCLYFYSWNDEPLPDPDLEAVANREWLWARPYTLLELQHLEAADRVTLPRNGEAGFAGFAFGDKDLTYLSADRLSKFF
ncbi:MAG: VOC family protein [Rhizobiales bacterium]|nr:VOC family protein [Hyphomicrobiales bacterium]